jgi:tRNA threonylcarbamoyladenosine biosynthesis protein TsaB
MRGMKLLAIEGSTAWLSVCAYDGQPVATARERSGANASERILEFVQRALAEARWRLDELDGIAYGSGPGAFTGLRVVCGAVQGLALGAGLPVTGVPSLLAMAQAAWRRHDATRVIACLDARMHEVYLGAYRRVDGDWLIEVEPTVARPADVAAPALGTAGWFGAGDGFAAAPTLAARLAPAGVDAAIVPEAVHVAELAMPKFAAGGGRPADEAQPLYVRHRVALTEAERAAGARQ